MNILVLEDDEILLTVIEEMVLALGHEPVKASTFAEGQRQFTASEFDVVLSDMKLRGESGVDFAKWVSTQDSFARFVLMTGYTDRLMELTRTSGIHGVICKPFRLNDLALTLEKVHPQRLNIGLAN